MNIGKDFYKNYIEHKTIPEILKEHSPEIYSSEAAYKTISLAVFDKITNKLVNELRQNSKASNKLSKRILWLDIILGAFTIAGAIFGAFSLLK